MLRLVLLAAITLPTLPSTGSISGTIYDNLRVAPANVPNGGTPQPIRVTAAGSAIRKAVSSDTTGLYRLDKLPPGVYRLEFLAPDSYTWSVEEVLVCAKVETLRDTSSPRMHARIMDAMMRALPGVQSDLAVHVTTTDGRPIAGAKLTIENLSDHRTSSAITADDGSHVFTPLRPGSYSLGVSGKGLDERNFSKITVAAAQRHELTAQVCAEPP